MTSEDRLFATLPSETSWTLTPNGEWTEIAVEQLPRSGNLLIEVSAFGDAEAAGLSLGPYKDFLAPLSRDMGERRLQLEIDGHARRWAFRADGTLMSRQWWDGAIGTTDDLLGGTLFLKARNAAEVVFRDLTIRSFDSSCRISVVMTCFRFAQRMRVALASWCRQKVPSGALEIIVVNPDSPDGTHQIVSSMAVTYPEVRLREVHVGGDRQRNKGWMLNRGSDVSAGEWLWFTDADCIFPDDAVDRVIASRISSSSLGYGERRHLTRRSTDAALSGRMDPASAFDRLAAETEGPPDIYPWGFTQILHRSQLQRVRYREDLDHFAGSDGAFLDDCRNAGLHEVRIDGLRCLHLAHPFAWNGTTTFL